MGCLRHSYVHSVFADETMHTLMSVQALNGTSAHKGHLVPYKGEGQRGSTSRKGTHLKRASELENGAETGGN